MPRTTSDLVEAILLDQYEDGDVLDPFISWANRLVTRYCAPVDSYDDDYLTEIETWLSAHAYKVVKRQEIQEQAGSVRVVYEGKVDLRLQVTEFGQQAMLLAIELAGLNNTAGKVSIRVKTGITYLGTDPCE